MAYDYSFSSHWGGDHARDRQAFAGKLSIERERLNSGGYTSGGRYFGTGAPLFRVSGEDGSDYADFYIRAKDRAAAKALVATGYPNAKGLGGSKKVASLKRAKRSKPRRRTAKRAKTVRRRRGRAKMRKRLTRRSRTMSLPKAGMSKFKAQAAYDRANSAARRASQEFRKATEMYRSRQIHDAAFLAEQAKHKAALAAFDAADADLKAVLAHEEAYSGKR
jgi:hypothetical protein